MIFSLKYRKQALSKKTALFIVIVDFTNAFDTVNCFLLQTMVKKIGCLETFVNLVALFQIVGCIWNQAVSSRAVLYPLHPS